MKDVVEFYNIISPLVPPERFCLDTELITTDRVHPRCPIDPKKNGIVAGIKRNGENLKPFLTKDYKKPFYMNNVILTIIIFLTGLYLLDKIYEKRTK